MAESAKSAEELAEEYTAEELYDKAQEYDVDGRSSMDKEELAEAVAKKMKSTTTSTTTEEPTKKTASVKKSASRKSSSSSKSDELLTKAANVLDVPRYNGHEATCKGATDSSVNCTCSEQRELLREIKNHVG